VGASDDARLHLGIGEVLADLGGVVIVVREIEQVVEDFQRCGELVEHVGRLAAELGHGFGGLGLKQIQILAQKRLSGSGLQGQRHLRCYIAGKKGLQGQRDMRAALLVFVAHASDGNAAQNYIIGTFPREGRSL